MSATCMCLNLACRHVSLRKSWAISREDFTSGTDERQENKGLVSIQAQLLLGSIWAPAIAQHILLIKREISQHHVAAITKLNGNSSLGCFQHHCYTLRRYLTKACLVPCMSFSGNTTKPFRTSHWALFLFYLIFFSKCIKINTSLSSHKGKEKIFICIYHRQLEPQNTLTHIEEISPVLN